MSTANTTTARAFFTQEHIDIETFIAITLDKAIRLQCFVGGSPVVVTVQRAEFLENVRAGNIQTLRVDEYGSSVYVLADF